MTTEAMRREFEKLESELSQASGRDFDKYDDLGNTYVSNLMQTKWIRYAAGRAAAGKDDWRAMVYAPMDGTEIELLLHHTNRRYADGDDKKMWEAVVRAKWIDHNGGGWTWQGMCGQPVGWRAIDAANTKDGSEG